MDIRLEIIEQVEGRLIAPLKDRTQKLNGEDFPKTRESITESLMNSAKEWVMLMVASKLLDRNIDKANCVDVVERIIVEVEKDVPERFDFSDTFEQIRGVVKGILKANDFHE